MCACVENQRDRERKRQRETETQRETQREREASYDPVANATLASVEARI